MARKAQTGGGNRPIREDPHGIHHGITKEVEKDSPDPTWSHIIIKCEKEGTKLTAHPRLRTKLLESTSKKPLVRGPELITNVVTNDAHDGAGARPARVPVEDTH